MQPAISLKQKIHARQLTLGALLTQELSLELLEIAMDSGLDYVIIDGEHSGHGAARIADVCRFGRRAGFAVLLRPQRTDPDSIRMAMDLGPCGLLLPMVESSAQLDGVRDGAYMPPRGKRRPGGPGNRWLRRHDYPSFKSEVENHLIVIPQVESVQGLLNADAIAAHPLTTALGVGPFDLSAQLGVCWDPQHPQLRAAMQTLRESADRAGKPFWTIGDPAQLCAEGYTFVCVGEPMALLQAALTQLAAELRRSATGAQGS
jgi:2-keto-3-deoxy-L-rhamnonate aldolase RhmA